MAKTGSLSAAATCASGRVEEAHMVERDDGVRPGLVEVLQARDLEPEEGAEDDRERSR